MTKNNNFYIIVGIIIVVALIYTKFFTSFAIYSNALSFPYYVEGYGTPLTENEKNTAVLCYSGNEWYVPLGPPTVPDVSKCTDVYGNTNFGIRTEYACSGTTCSFSYVQLELTNPDMKVLPSGETSISPYLNVYSVDSGSNNKVYYSINTPIACNSNGCSGTLFAERTYPYVRLYKMDLSSYAGQKITNIYFATFSHKSTDERYGGGIMNIEANILVQSPVTYNPVDTNKDGKVDRSELGFGISNWVSGSVTRTDLGNAIQLWVSG